MYALMVFKVFQKPFIALYNYYHFLFASLNLLANFEMLTVTLLRIPFSVFGQCSPMQTSHWLQEKCARINLSQAAASSMIIQNHGRLSVSIFGAKIAALGSSKWVTRDFKS